MPSPQEPEDEPVGDELPDESPDKLRDEDALWRAIIENYGERPAFEEPRIEAPPSLRDLDRPVPVAGHELEQPADREEHYVPPAPPPLPRPTPARLLAWTGLFGVPALVLVALVAGLNLAPWMGLILMVWFVAGFVYLVASMGPGPGDDFDDGARL